MPNIVINAKTKHIIPIQDGNMVMMDMQVAKWVGDALMSAYPRYHWLVNASSEGGVITIECGEIARSLSTNMHYKMVMKYSNAHDYGLLVKKALRMAGELLERASLPRGKWNGADPLRVDGVKEHHQPAVFNQPSIRLVGIDGRPIS